MPVNRTLVFSLALATCAAAQDKESVTVPLTVSKGAPLRLYLTKRVAKRVNAPVEAKVLAPLFAFDREVVPNGTQVFGHVSRLEPVSKWARTKAVLGGDFTPLHIAEIEFTSMQLPDGRHMDLQTVETPGLNSIASLKPPKQKPAQDQPAGHGGVMGTATHKAKEQVDMQIERIKGIPDLVRGTNKKEWLYDYTMSRLPYHPQYVRNRTRFDAVLKAPLSFGAASLSPDLLGLIGSQPVPGSIAHARLITSLDSFKSKPGEKVEAVLEQPLFSADHKLVLPEGTLVTGSVVMTKPAGWFHHAGRLRFTFKDIELTPEAVAVADAQKTSSPAPAAGPPRNEPKQLQLRTQAQLSGAESATAPVNVDSEGGVQAKESKTRFIGTAIALLITRAAADNDEGHHHLETNGQSSNVGGRTLGGGLGFGLLGAIAAQSSNNVGAVLSYYGLAWTVFSTVIARGAEVQFDRNSAIDIGFNPRNASK